VGGRPDTALGGVLDADLVDVPQPSSMLSQVRPSNRSGVCAVCPALRSSSANAQHPASALYVMKVRFLSHLDTPFSSC
jgi:hypothetical protein